MPARSDRPLKKITINIFEDQADSIESLFPGKPFADVVRAILDSYIKLKKDKINASINRSE